MKRFMHAMALSAVIASSGLLEVVGVLQDMPGRPYLVAFLDQFAHALIMTTVVVAIIAAVERTRARGIQRAALQSVALLLGVPCAALGVASLAGSYSFIAQLGVGSADGLFPIFLWFGFTAAVLLSWYYAVRERAARAIDALAEESVLRHAALRRADEARLRALRTQVEPASLDAKLAAIHEAYRGGGDAGDRMLDDLIDYLTAALRDSHATPRLN